MEDLSTQEITDEDLEREEAMERVLREEAKRRGIDESSTNEQVKTLFQFVHPELLQEQMDVKTATGYDGEELLINLVRMLIAPSFSVEPTLH